MAHDNNRIARGSWLVLALVSGFLLTLVFGGTALAGPARAPSAIERGDLEWQMMADVNAARAERGLPELSFDDTLIGLARQRSEDMAANGYFSHFDANGNPIFIELLDANGVPFLQAGENLARNTYGDDQTAQVVVNEWAASPAHADNMFNGGYNRAGVGVVMVEDGTKVFTMILVAE